MKTEKIEIVVSYTVKYDDTRASARDHAIGIAVDEVPIELGGCCIDNGCFSVIRGSARLLCKPPEVASKPISGKQSTTKGE